MRNNPLFRKENGKIDYGRIAATEKFRQVIERLMKGLTEGWQIVLLCAEGSGKLSPAPAYRHRA